jgi:hypothetical protein
MEPSSEFATERVGYEFALAFDLNLAPGDEEKRVAEQAFGVLAHLNAAGVAM